MSSNDALRDGIRRLLVSHPKLQELDPSTVRNADTVKVERYRYGASGGIGHEPGRKTQQNLWVLSDAVTLKDLADIRHVVKPGYGKGDKPGRDSNLEQIPGFRHASITCFMPKTLDEAKRVIAAAAGPWGTT